MCSYPRRMATLDRRVQVLFDPEQYARLEHEAQRERRSVGAFIRDCVDARLRSTRRQREEAWARLQAVSAASTVHVGTPEELAAELDGMLDSFGDEGMPAR